ncbi:hypothetical protein GCM10027296_29710 [Chitinimonas naiadis]
MCLAGKAPDRQGAPSQGANRQIVKRGEALYRAGEAFHALYVVHSGFFKTYAINEEGREQVTGFHMGGELLGLDGIDTDQHRQFAVALEDSQVCVVPFTALGKLCATTPTLQRRLLQLMGREISRSQELAMQLSGVRAEERVGHFLLDLSRRFAERGYSAHEFHLRMTREEIGSHLGLKLETVSRVLSRLDELGLIHVRQRHIRIPDTGKLANTVQADKPALASTLH